MRTITEKARAMISGAKLNKVFWGEAVLTVTHLINISPTKALSVNKTPYELWHGKKPHLKYLRVFGSTVHVHSKVRKTKFDDKSWIAILVGYEPNGYKVWDVEGEKFVTVRDVIFDETNYLTSRPLIKFEKSNVESSYKETDASDVLSKSVMEPQKSDNGKSDISKSSLLRESDKNAKLDYNESNESVKEADKNDKSFIENSKNTSKNCKNEPEPRRSDRIKNLPPITYNENESHDYLMIAQSLFCKIPNSFEEIKFRNDRAQWEHAINDELNSHFLNETWILVSRPINKNIVDCKWVFTIKNDEFGNSLKYKARLIARGFSQEYLIDYNETFAPVT